MNNIYALCVVLLVIIYSLRRILNHGFKGHDNLFAFKVHV